MAKRILYPGRFQPFHLGHLYAIKKLLERYDEVVIVVGSAQEGYTCRNPFTAGERLEMIDKTLRSEGIMREKYWLIPAPDLNKPLAWTTYVLGMVPRVEAVATGNPHVSYLYKWMGLDVINLELYKPNKYNGTIIRKLMYLGGDWASRIHPTVAEYIESINGVERVRRLCDYESC